MWISKLVFGVCEFNFNFSRKNKEKHQLKNILEILDKLEYCCKGDKFNWQECVNAFDHAIISILLEKYGISPIIVDQKFKDGVFYNWLKSYELIAGNTIMDKFKILSDISEELKTQIKIFHIFDDFKGYNVLFITKNDEVFGFGSNECGGCGLRHNSVVKEPQIIPELCHKIFNNSLLVLLLLWLLIQISKSSLGVKIIEDSWEEE